MQLLEGAQLADEFRSKNLVLLVTVQQLGQAQESFPTPNSHDSFFEASTPVAKDLILKNADKLLADAKNYGLDMDSEPDSDIALDDNLSTPSKQTSLSRSSHSLLKYAPTVPCSESRSLSKPTSAPLDLQWPLQTMMFNTLEAALHYIYSYEQQCGYVWKKAESVHDHTTGVIKRLRIRCNCHGSPRSSHKNSIDPSDFRKGKSKRTGCSARVNIRCSAELGTFHFASVDLIHNHPTTHNDNLPIYNPPSEAQKEMVRTLVPLKTLTRSDIATLLLSCFPDHPLLLRQVANLMNLSHHEARNAVQNLGRDMVAIVQRLTELKAADDR
ncbi:hypothetical protein EDD85DRAFT_948390 [Armillaria nabsnona]|nr:hypothetical protein EDD85DRAFT_948390 [Armillaria nabsnona]